MGNFNPGPNSRDKLAALTNSTYRVTPLVQAASAVRQSALSGHPARSLHDLYAAADPESAGNYDAGVFGLLGSGDPRLRSAKPLGRFDNHPGALAQQDTDALRALLAAVLSQHGYRTP